MKIWPPQCYQTFTKDLWIRENITVIKNYVKHVLYKQ